MEELSMSRLHEHQSKALLTTFGISIPQGGVAGTAAEARALAEEIGGSVVVKAQVWLTSRADLGGIRFADNPEEAERAAASLLGTNIGPFTVEQVLVEERLDIAEQFYAGITVDDRARAPVAIFSSAGGTGIETVAAGSPDQIAHHLIDIELGLRPFEARNLVRKTGVHGDLLRRLGNVLPRLYRLARRYDARAAEINPLVLTTDGNLVAADCRITIDDHAVYRQPDLGIEIAREFDHPATELEKIAWQVEKDDYRGTFYFIQLDRDFRSGEGVIGFHGAGGGGSMISMDAVHSAGMKVANYVDTSGNPPASKVYRAARIILSQPGIDGYFASGSGVASQEQYHSARGLIKAFFEAPLLVPAVVRLGGNGEEHALALLKRAAEHLPAPLEGYGKDDPAEACALRLRELIDSYAPPAEPSGGRPAPQATKPYRFETVSGGTVTLDHAKCLDCHSKICLETCAPNILSLENGVPVLNISHEAARRGGCVECLACEVECYLQGNGGGHLGLPIEGLETYTGTEMVD
jgi:succinyl-CoA synthetase beta subunit